MQRATVSTVRSLKHSRGGEERLEKRQKLEKIPNLRERFEKSQKRRKCKKSWQSTNQSGGLIKILDVKFGAFHPAGGENHRARGESLLIATAEWSYLMPLCTALRTPYCSELVRWKGRFSTVSKPPFATTTKTRSDILQQCSRSTRFVHLCTALGSKIQQQFAASLVVCLFIF